MSVDFVQTKNKEVLAKIKFKSVENQDCLIFETATYKAKRYNLKLIFAIFRQIAITGLSKFMLCDILSNQNAFFYL